MTSNVWKQATQCQHCHKIETFAAQRFLVPLLNWAFGCLWYRLVTHCVECKAEITWINNKWTHMHASIQDNISFETDLNNLDWKVAWWLSQCFGRMRQKDSLWTGFVVFFSPFTVLKQPQGPSINHHIWGIFKFAVMGIAVMLPLNFEIPAMSKYAAVFVLSRALVLIV